MIDDAQVPQHGRWWCHLASDTSFGELHEFARAVGIPARGFDGDHYDVPVERRDNLVSAGALPVTSRELVLALSRAGLRRRRPRSAKRRPTYRTELVSAIVPVVGPRYDETHRHYHTRSHIDAMLVALGALWDQPGYIDVPREPMVLAIWLHDAIYDPTRDDNEVASAAFARELLTWLHAEPALVAEVERLVLLTVAHAPEPDDRGGALLSDADLSVLAQGQDEYDAYVRDVRLEYGFVDDATFQAGRAAVLRAMLRRSWLFSTPRARDHWEPVARVRMQAELVHLEG